MTMNVIFMILTGCLVVAIFDALGSMLSRQLNFNYAWLTVGSVIIYALFSVSVANMSSSTLGVLTGGILGVFDSTVGMLIGQKLQANAGNNQNIKLEVTLKMMLGMACFGLIVGLISIYLFNFIGK